jgi:glycolate oxidase FAD binding subunit
MATAAARFHLGDLERYGAARLAVEGDAVDGVEPAAVVEPATAAETATLLAWASSQRLSTVIRGGGTKLGWGAPPGPIDIVLATTRLRGALEHRHGDLTATVQAGESLLAINRQLASLGQWLPIDSAFDEATIGGIVATNDSGPLRSRYGTPRDLVIGITLAMTDGRVVKSGGHVVKNVAGYDLGRLMSGSFGTLAAIVDVTLKLLPMPVESKTLVARYDEAAAMCADVVRMAGSQLEPAAFDVCVRHAQGEAPQNTLLVRFATSPEAMNAQADAARALLSTDVADVADSEESALWDEQVRHQWASPGTMVRLGWLPAALPQVLAILDEVRRESGGAVDLRARVVTGAGVLRVEADDAGAERAVTLLRARAPVVSNVVVLRASTALKMRVGAWGSPASAASVLKSLKRTFDPEGILNAGRGPI